MVAVRRGCMGPEASLIMKSPYLSTQKRFKLKKKKHNEKLNKFGIQAA